MQLILKLSTCSASNLPNFYFTRVAAARCESLNVTLGIEMASQEQGQVTFNLTQDSKKGPRSCQFFFKLACAKTWAMDGGRQNPDYPDYSF